MNKCLLTAVFLMTAGWLSAQTVILDHETGPTSTTFSYFGNCGDYGSTTIIANPDATGINTSANVGEFIKRSCAFTWAGAFANPVPSTPVDLTSDNQICIKVWMPVLGNLGFKLESSTTGGDNWITTQTVTAANQWVELCYDATLPSIEAPFTAAAGNSYDQVVLFFEFGVPGTGSDVTYYFDDVVTDSVSPTPDPDVTFSVDMNSETSGFSNVYVFGGFNSWCIDCDELLDGDSDGVYEGTVNMPAGNYDYLYRTDLDQEAFNGTEGCIPNNGTGFFNRNFTAGVTESLPTVCYTSCYGCNDALVNITFEIGMSGVGGADSVYLAGGGNFDNPGGPYIMTDPDGDSIYTITVTRPQGFGGYYTFANGNCPDYSCKENIAGQPCARPENFNDRFLDPVMNDTTIGTCFAFCAIDAMCTPEACSSANPPTNVTSTLGAGNVTLSWDRVWQSVACQINGGPVGGGTANLNLLSFEATDRTLGSGIIVAGTTYAWKVRCACSIPPGPLDVTAFSISDTFTVPALRQVEPIDNLMDLELSPNPARDLALVSMRTDQAGSMQFRITDIAGVEHSRWLAQLGEGLNEITIDVSELAEGLYFLQPMDGQAHEAVKFIVGH